MKSNIIGLGVLIILVISVAAYADTYIGLQGAHQLPNCARLESYMNRKGYSVTNDSHFKGLILQKPSTNNVFIFVTLEKEKIRSQEYWMVTVLDPISCVVMSLDIREVSEIQNEKLFRWIFEMIKTAITNAPVKIDYRTESRPVIRFNLAGNHEKTFGLIINLKKIIVGSGKAFLNQKEYMEGMIGFQDWVMTSKPYGITGGILPWTHECQVKEVGEHLEIVTRKESEEGMASITTNVIRTLDDFNIDAMFKHSEFNHE